MEAAIVHDYFVQDGGAERVAVELANSAPQRRVYTTFFDAKRFGDRIDPVTRSYLARLPAALMSATSERCCPCTRPISRPSTCARYDLVVSSSSAFAKAIRTSRRHLHVAYVHAPMRFAWQFQEYERGSSLSAAGARWPATCPSGPLRIWDQAHVAPAGSPGGQLAGRARADCDAGGAATRT